MKFKIFVILNFIMACCACSNQMEFEKANTSNCEKLYEQPLKVIQECIHGKWKIDMISRLGSLGVLFPKNTFIEIDTKSNNFKLSSDEQERFWIMYGRLSKTSFSYTWKKKEVYVYGTGKRSGFTTFVMQNNEQEIEGWYFERIENEALFIVIDYPLENDFCEKWKCVKIKENN